MKLRTTRTKKHSEPVSFRLLRWIALFTIEAALLMIYWRVSQIYPSIQSILSHKKNEMELIVRIASLRQLLRIFCIIYGLLQIIVSWKIMFLSYECFLIKRRFLQKISVFLTLIGILLQYLSLTDLYTNIFMVLCFLCQCTQTFLVLSRGIFRLIFSATVTVYVLFLTGALVFGYTYCRKEEPKTSKTGVSTEAVLNKNILYQIWDMSTENEFYHAAFYEQKKGTDYGLIPIPGMEYADSVTGGVHSEIETCTSMTPQGITVTNNYIFVSAYCYTHEHNSVIFMIDKDTGNFIKEIVLPEKTHVGGLAYDPEYGTLWLTTKMKQETEYREETVSALACITDEDIISYSFADSGQPIEYRNICPTQFKSNSCLAYKDGYIYIGYWMKSKMAMSVAGKFQVRKSGVSVKDRASEILHIPGQVQGLAFNEDQIYFTVSYGMNKSTLLMYTNDEEEKTRIFPAASPDESIDLPQMLEGICLCDGMLYTLFESSAFAYRYTSPVCMDHIVKIRISGVKSFESQASK